MKTTLQRHIILLGAGRSLRGKTPTVVRALDWLVSAYDGLPRSRFSLVSGFQAGHIVNRFENLETFYNPQWQTTGPVFSLSLVPLMNSVPTFVSYADIAYRSSLIEKMDKQKKDIVIAVDSHWRTRYDGRPHAALVQAEKVNLHKKSGPFLSRNASPEKADAEFMGLVRFSAKALATLQSYLKFKMGSHREILPELLNQLIASGLSWSAVDSEGDWAALDASQDLARFVLGTKAESLERLKPLVRKCRIPESFFFTEKEWRTSPAGVLKKIKKRIPFGQLIVRSSALGEDSWTQSQAGKNLSVPAVPGNDASQIEWAIRQVFSSYNPLGPHDQVLVQPHLDHVEVSGVILTRAQNGNSPYCVISYDSTPDRTDGVTSGTGSRVRTFYHLRGTRVPKNFPGVIESLLEAVKEIEGLVGHDSLDIEFAVTEDEKIWLLQVRPLIVTKAQRSFEDSQLREQVELASRWFTAHQNASPWLLGQRTALNVMSDWNPAEIIGTRPSPLAFSLYRYLITDETWATQRAEFGYRDVRPCPLVLNVLGHPFIDVRATFNSFIPASLPDGLAEKLVDYSLRYLEAEPHLYDKVEFEILFTCLSFDFPFAAKRLTAVGFAPDELESIQQALREITVKAVARNEKDYALMTQLQRRHQLTRESGLSPLAMAYSLLEEVRRSSALNFAHLAREAFIAVTLLRSLEKQGTISPEEKEAFLASLNTVSNQVRTDALAAKRREMTRAEFYATYGHLRPGTYDITSPRYDSEPSRFLEPLIEEAAPRQPHETFRWSESTQKGITGAIAKARFAFTFDQFETFCRRSIEGRELSKFYFTRSLSDGMELVAKWAGEQGLSREEVSLFCIGDLLPFREPVAGHPKDFLRHWLEQKREHQEMMHSLCLPPHVFTNDDLFGFEQLKAVPSFVTRERVCAQVVSQKDLGGDDNELRGKIVLIPSADPGYDWVLSKGIAGLITMYGGTNSHMAIRAAELRLPAAIGVGQALFEKLAKAHLIELDCSFQRVAVVSYADAPYPATKKVA